MLPSETSPFVSTPGGDPLDRLPYEIWVRCICLASYGASYGPLPFLSVSSRWESAIIDEPEAWSSIEVNQEKDLAARLSVFISLSRHHLLDVQFSLPQLTEDTLESLKTMLRSISHRIRSLTFTPETRSIGVTNLLELLTTEGVRYPELKVVGFQGIHGQGDFSDFLLLCPKLRVASSCILEEPNVSTFCARLQELNASISDLDQVQTLIENTSLTWLQLRHFHQRKCSTKLRESHTVSQLEYLKCHSVPKAIDIVVFGVSHPYLRTLHLHLPTFMARWFISCIASLPSLKSLTIEHHMTRDTFDCEPDTAEVAKFPLSQPLLEDFVLASGVNDNSLLNEIVPLICDSAILRQVQSLSITLGKFHRYEASILSPLCSLLSTASKAQVKYLKVDSHRFDLDETFPDNTTPPAVVEMPMVDTLVIAVAEMLDLISAPNVERMEIRTTFGFVSSGSDTDDDGDGDKNQDTETEPNSNTNLQAENVSGVNSSLDPNPEMATTGVDVGVDLATTLPSSSAPGPINTATADDTNSSIEPVGLTKNNEEDIKVAPKSKARREVRLPDRRGSKLVKLKVYSDSTDIINRSLPDDDQRRSFWEGVTHITWSARHNLKYPIIPFLSSLTVLRLVTPINGNLAAELPVQGGTSAINLFLIELLRNDGACPNLQALEMDLFPCWDLLFRVLSRRYAQSCLDSDKGVGLLRSITLPFLPVVPILRQIVKYLGGDNQERCEINYEQTLRTRWTYLFFVVCFKCLNAGYICCWNKEEEYPEVEVEEEDQTEDSMLRRKPTNEQMLALMNFEPAVEGASDSEALMRLSTEDWLEALFHLPEGDIMMYREDCGRDKQFGPVTITASTPVGSELIGKTD